MALKYVGVQRTAIEYESEDLFRNYVGEDAEEVERVHSTPDKYETPEDFEKLGEAIKDLSARFEASDEGQRVKLLSDRISLNNFSGQSLIDVGRGVFKDGVNGYTIVAFFSFCKHLFLRAIRSVRDSAVEVYRWTTSFIIDKICPWVEEQGGWMKVLAIIATILGGAVLAVGVGIMLL
ncbi:Bcl-2-like protein 1, partial [Stegodyphus mimosarum]